MWKLSAIDRVDDRVVHTVRPLTVVKMVIMFDTDYILREEETARNTELEILWLLVVIMEAVKME